jgi:TRAP-type mannitol/chloroaromatic compound transport system substrate-binding protein
MASPTEVTVFGGYFPFASRYSLDVPVLFNQYGLNEIWDAEYSKVGVKHISAGAWDPCHFNTKDPIRSLEDLIGKRVFTFPTAGRFLTQFGVVPVTLPWEDIEVAVQTGELDGIAWSGITEDYTVGWADVTDYFLTNNISGAWAGSFFANMDRWNELPPHLQELLRMAMDSSHYYRQWWYWGGERTKGTKLKLTTIPDEEWATVESAAVKFWDEIAARDDDEGGTALPLRLILSQTSAAPGFGAAAMPAHSEEKPGCLKSSVSRAARGGAAPATPVAVLPGRSRPRTTRLPTCIRRQ